MLSLQETTRRTIQKNCKIVEEESDTPTQVTSEAGQHQRLLSTEDDFTNTYETKAVYYLKMLLLALLCALAVGVAATVFFLSRSSEMQIFEEAAADDSAKILESVGGTMDMTLGAIDSLVVSITSWADNSNNSWPFVTLPDHAVKFSKVRALSKALYICFFPFVSLAQKPMWEQYSLQQGDAWVQDAMDQQKKDVNYHGIHLDEYYDPSPVIYSVDGPVDGPGPFFPSWQAYPIVPIWSPFNWDYGTYAFFDKEEVIENLRVSTSKVINMPDSDDESVINEAAIYSDWAKDFVGQNENADEPFFPIFYPVVQDAAKEISHFDWSSKDSERTHDHDASTSSNKTAVGVVTIIIYVRDLIRNTLTADSVGMVVVFENQCNQTFSYTIRGPEVEYLGRGDHHDPHYHHLEHSSALIDLHSSISTSSSSLYSGFPLSEKGCQYKLRVYPSSEMEARFTTSNPVRFTIAFTLVFAFTLGVFLVFDRCVERKNRRVVYAALRHLEGANRSIVEASKKQLEHFASMSHEIRTPLNCIIGMSNLLLETEEFNESTKESMQMITASGDLLLTVVNDVLDVAKLASDKVAIHIERTNLNQAITTVIKNIQLSGKGKKVSFKYFCHNDVPAYLDTDSRRLQQVVYNLLSNAQKFSVDGGPIELTVSVTVSVERDLTDKQVGGMVASVDGVMHLVVKDYGMGISENDIEKIFEPFSQSSRKSDEAYAGTGLGLAITSKLVKLLGGSIRVDSELGEWTEFTINIPYYIEEGAGRMTVMHPSAFPPCKDIPLCLGQNPKMLQPGLVEESNSRPEISMTELRVLNADDSTVNRKLLRKILMAMGLTHIEEARDGREAVDMTAQGSFDIVFMDIDMPHLTGIEATRIIKARNDHHNMSPPKIYFVTAHALQSFEMEAKASGGDGFITKPYAKTQIVGALQSATEEKQRLAHSDKPNESVLDKIEYNA